MTLRQYRPQPSFTPSILNNGFEDFEPHHTYSLPYALFSMVKPNLRIVHLITSANPYPFINIGFSWFVAALKATEYAQLLPSLKTFPIFNRIIAVKLCTAWAISNSPTCPGNARTPEERCCLVDWYVRQKELPNATCPIIIQKFARLEIRRSWRWLLIANYDAWSQIRIAYRDN